MRESNPFAKAAFLTSAPTTRELPQDTGSEVAFVGRSNAGKSSAINAICGQKKLAKASSTPGRTQALIVFSIAPDARLVDLPGFGYAKVPARIRERWRHEIDRYLRDRESLRGLVLIIDARHPLKEFEQQMLRWCAETELPVLALLTKADKISRGVASTHLSRVERFAEQVGARARCQLFSSTTPSGLTEAREALWRLLRS